MVSVQRAEESRKANQMHGLSRTLVNNMVVGVSEGYTKQLRCAQGLGWWPGLGGTLVPLARRQPPGVGHIMQRKVSVRMLMCRGCGMRSFQGGSEPGAVQKHRAA